MDLLHQEHSREGETRSKGHLVDGSEIRLSPVEVGSLSHYLRGCFIPDDCLGFLPSTVPSLTDGILRSFST